MKKKLWMRKLECGHERATTIAFMFKRYNKPKIGEICFCRVCNKNTKIIEVEEAKSIRINKKWKQ